jgi:fructokinase
MTKDPLIVSVGEVLWDVFPQGLRLGGAPANVAVHAAAMGAKTVLLSCVGEDPMGRDAVAKLGEHRVDTRWIQWDEAHPTGSVRVDLVEGQPRYQIVEAVAWDHILWRDELKALAKSADVICFGTLAQRQKTSRETIQRFVDGSKKDCLRVLDLNFRQQYHASKAVQQSMALANVLKLNEEEVPILRSYVGGVEDSDAFLRDLLVRFDLQWVILTLGQAGCCVYGASGIWNVKSEPMTVVDTVGAGDAFTAALVCHLLLGSDAKTCAHKANAAGGFVVTQNGATPTLPPSFRMFD